MTQHGNAKVRPDGRVNVGVAIDADLYRTLFDWSREWGMTMGEVIEDLVKVHMVEVGKFDGPPA